MSQELAIKTVQRVKEGLKRNESATVTEVIQLFHELASRAFTISVQELADLICKDVTLMAKVLSASNTLGYNPHGVPVTTIAQAIQIVGFSKIRNLAISLLLVDKADQSGHLLEQTEVAALALSSGVLAQNILERKGFPDPDRAFVCASLRNYGKLLLSTYLVEEFRYAKDLARQLGQPDEAFERVFGLTPINLGFRILSDSQLPTVVLESLQPVTAETLRTQRPTPGQELQLCSDFSVQLCELAVDPDITPADFERRTGDLAARFGNSLPQEEQLIQELLKTVDNTVRNLCKRYGFAQLPASISGGFKARVNGASPPKPAVRTPVVPPKTQGSPVFPGAHGRAAPQAILSASGDQATKGYTPPADQRLLIAPDQEVHGPSREELLALDILQKGIAQMTFQIGFPHTSFQQIVEIAVQTIHQALRLDDLVLLIRDEDSGIFVARSGKGAIIDGIRNRPVVDPEERTLFSISISQRKDILIHDATLPKIQPHVPKWMKMYTVRSLVILPVQDMGEVVIVLSGSRSRGRALDLSGEVYKALQAFRIHFATALRVAGRNVA